MPTEVNLPACLFDTVKTLFPTLDFSRIKFHSGLKWPYSIGDQPAMVLPAGNGRVDVFFASDRFIPCQKDFMFSLYHELVHALQVQDGVFGGKGPGALGEFSVGYLSCWFRDGSDTSNRFEAEATHYEEVFRRAVRLVQDEEVAALHQRSNAWPCVFGQLGVCGANPNFVGVDRWIAAEADIVRSDAEERGVCTGGAVRLPFRLLGIPLPDDLSGAALRLAAAAAVVSFFLGGGIPGALLAGAVTWLTIMLDEYTGVISTPIAFATAVTAVLIGLVVGLATAISGALGLGTRPIKLMVSADDAATFTDGTVLGDTGEPPAMAVDRQQLFMSWKAGNDKVNVLHARTGSDPTIVMLGDSGDSGPALAWSGTQLTLLWQRSENRLVVRVSDDGWEFAPRRLFGGKVLDDATPGITTGWFKGAQHWHAAWIRRKNKEVGIKHSVDGENWPYETSIALKSHSHGTAAIALGSRQCLYVAWPDKSTKNLRLATLHLADDGGIAAVFNIAHLDNEPCSDESGPALAFGNEHLFMAWVRRDQHVQVRAHDLLDVNGVPNFVSDYVTPGLAKDSAGPALAYAESGTAGIPGTLVLGYVRKH